MTYPLHLTRTSESNLSSSHTHSTYPPFEEIRVTTRTIVIDTSITVDIARVFETFPVHPLEQYPSSKKKFRNFIHQQGLEDGTIIALEYENAQRGIPVKHFRNAMSISMIIDSKVLNFKVPPQGKIQITGCKHERYAHTCIQHLWRLLNEVSTTLDTPLYQFRSGFSWGYPGEFSAIFRIVMSNRNFNLGFIVNRQKLDHYVNTQTRFPGKSLLELAFSYTGLNIKLPCTIPNTRLNTLCFHNNAWEFGTIQYETYLRSLSPRQYNKEVNKIRNNTFLVFRSGAAIMSGHDETIRDDYYAFVDMITRCRHLVEDTHALPEDPLEEEEEDDSVLVVDATRISGGQPMQKRLRYMDSLSPNT